MKWDHFYEGLNPKYQHILAHKVDGKHPASYSNLLLVAWKLERHAEVRDPLLPKTTITWGSNVTQLQTPGNLFPSRKLMGNCTITAWSTTVESTKAEEDLSIKPERDEEAESSAEEDTETLCGVGGADQLVGYIVHFANAVKLYQRKIWNCFRCGSPDHLIKDCPKDFTKTTLKASLNEKDGMAKKGGQAHWKPVVAQLAIPDEALKAWRHLKKFPSWTPIHLIGGVDLRT